MKDSYLGENPNLATYLNLTVTPIHLDKRIRLTSIFILTEYMDIGYQIILVGMA